MHCSSRLKSIKTIKTNADTGAAQSCSLEEQDQESPPAGKAEEFEYQIRKVKQSEMPPPTKRVREQKKSQKNKGNGYPMSTSKNRAAVQSQPVTQPIEGEEYAAAIPCHAPPNQPKSKTHLKERKASSSHHLPRTPHHIITVDRHRTSKEREKVRKSYRK